MAEIDGVFLVGIRNYEGFDLCAAFSNLEAAELYARGLYESGEDGARVYHLTLDEPDSEHRLAYSCWSMFMDKATGKATSLGPSTMASQQDRDGDYVGKRGPGPGAFDERTFRFYVKVWAPDGATAYKRGLRLLRQVGDLSVDEDYSDPPNV